MALLDLYHLGDLQVLMGLEFRKVQLILVYQGPPSDPEALVIQLSLQVLEVQDHQ